MRGFAGLFGFIWFYFILTYLFYPFLDERQNREKQAYQIHLHGQKIENPHKPGDFIDAPPVKDAIVMNIGDLMQRWTNGASRFLLSSPLLPLPFPTAKPSFSKTDTLKSSLHRVNPPASKTTTTSNLIPARYSIPYFVGPTLDTVVTCLPECLDGTTPAKHKPILWQDYMLMRARMNYED
jgi:isopenicillin N synthase-like dioxygenase